MKHDWFKDTNFENLQLKRAIPPYQPVEDVDYIDSMFLDKDIGRANDPSPPGSMEFNENNFLEVTDFEYSMYD